jgi:hypothetical protein
MFAVICSAIVVVGILGTAALEPRDSVAVPAAPESESAGVWAGWVGELGFDDTSGDVMAASPARVQAAIDSLDAVDFEAWNSELRVGSATTMRLASWLWSSLREDQVAVLHEQMPRLEPRVMPGAVWQRVDIGLDDPPTIDDIHQGRADDCWLIAALGAVALADPAMLSERVTRNVNGTYTVRWTIDGAEVPVTVTPYLPTDDDGALLYAHGEHGGRPNWTSLFEKAHAALPQFGSFARLAGGAMVEDSPVTVAAAMAALTGGVSTTRPARSITIDELREALEDGRPVAATTFLTGLSPEAGDGDVPLIDRHVYVVESVEEDTILLRNPWGVSSTAGPEIARLSIEDLNRRILSITFGAPADA